MVSTIQRRAEAGLRRANRAGLLVFGLAIIAALGCAGCKKQPPEDEMPGAAPIRGVLHLEPFVVNLADSEDNRFLRVGIDLGLETAVPAKQGNGGESGVPTARIRDCVLSVVTTWRSDALLAAEGKQKLKDQILHALQSQVPELGVKEIYFTDFLVQR